MNKFKFIDLFAGIGGTRIAFEEAGCECVFSSEWDKFAQLTYEANFGEKPAGDINLFAVIGKKSPNFGHAQGFFRGTAVKNQVFVIFAS